MSLLSAKFKIGHNQAAAVFLQKVRLLQWSFFKTIFISYFSIFGNQGSKDNTVTVKTSGLSINFLFHRFSTKWT